MGVEYERAVDANIFVASPIRQSGCSKRSGDSGRDIVGVSGCVKAAISGEAGVRPPDIGAAVGGTSGGGPDGDARCGGCIGVDGRAVPTGFSGTEKLVGMPNATGDGDRAGVAGEVGGTSGGAPAGPV